MTTLQPFFTGTANLTINGGTIDDSVIGDTVPAAGSFTTLDASGVITGTDGTAASAYGTGSATGVAAVLLAGGMEVTANSFFAAGVEVAGVTIVSDATASSATDPDGTGAGTAALRITGGFEANAKSYVGADLLIGGIADIEGVINGRNTDPTTSTVALGAQGDGAMQLAGGSEILGDSYFGANLEVQGNLTIGGTLSATVSETVVTWTIPADGPAPAIDSPGIWIFRPAGNPSVASTVITGTLDFPTSPTPGFAKAGDRIRIFISCDVGSGSFGNLEAFELELTDGYVAANGTALDATGTADVIRFTARGQSVTLIYVDDGTQAGWMNENAGAFIEQR